jgi:hypothetical protein
MARRWSCWTASMWSRRVHTPRQRQRAAAVRAVACALTRPQPTPAAVRFAAAQGIDTILEASLTEDVAFLVVGDPFAATTHTDLQLRARCAPPRNGCRKAPCVCAHSPPTALA